MVHQVNGAALRQLKFSYADLFDVVCFSHTLDNVGSHFEFQFLDSFIRFWISFFFPTVTMQGLQLEIKLGSQLVASVTHGGGASERCSSRCLTCLGCRSFPWASPGNI